MKCLIKPALLVSLFLSDALAPGPPRSRSMLKLVGSALPSMGIIMNDIVKAKGLPNKKHGIHLEVYYGKRDLRVIMARWRTAMST